MMFWNDGFEMLFWNLGWMMFLNVGFRRLLWNLGWMLFWNDGFMRLLWKFCWMKLLNDGFEMLFWNDGKSVRGGAGLYDDGKMGKAYPNYTLYRNYAFPHWSRVHIWHLRRGRTQSRQSDPRRFRLLQVDVLFSKPYMGVSINGESPKWLVYSGKSHQSEWFGVPLFQETTIYIYIWYSPATHPQPPSWSWSRVASKYMIDVGSTLPPRPRCGVGWG